MKKLCVYFFSLLCLLLPNFAFSLDTALKGFIALDALNYEKIQRQKGAAVIGIGVLDLKVFAEQDYMTAAIKLDLDNSHPEVQNNIFEEAYASYRGVPGWRFTLGKGIVKFQNLHWGAVENTYLDGGSILGTENGWRKVSRKAFISSTYGNRGMGFADTFTFYGDSTEIKTDEKGNPLLVFSKDATSTGASGTPYKVSGYTLQQVPAFSTDKQFGLANKIELYRFQNWVLTSGQIFYKNKLAPRASYGIDFGATRDADDIEYWVDLMYGVSSKGPFEQFTTYEKNEYFVQLGTQYHFNALWSVIGNAEYTHVKDHQHESVVFLQDGKYYQGDTARTGQTIVTANYKIESAAQYQLSKTSFITMGGLYERKYASLNGVKGLSFIRNVYNPNAEAFKLASSISFWF
jgi:hypothetical protein